MTGAIRINRISHNTINGVEEIIVGKKPSIIRTVKIRGIAPISPNILVIILAKKLLAVFPISTNQSVQQALSLARSFREILINHILNQADRSDSTILNIVVMVCIDELIVFCASLSNPLFMIFTKNMTIKSRLKSRTCCFVNSNASL